MKKEDIGCLIKLISDRMRAQWDADLKAYDLTFSQVRILHYLHQSKAEASQKEICQHLDATHPTVIGLVSRLEKNGFVECYVDPSDRRNKMVRLTPKADAFREQVEKKRQQNHERMTAGLSQEEVEELLFLLNKVWMNYEGGII